jgi:hypothetical protein
MSIAISRERRAISGSVNAGFQALLHFVAGLRAEGEGDHLEFRPIMALE